MHVAAVPVSLATMLRGLAGYDTTSLQHVVAGMFVGGAVAAATGALVLLAASSGSAVTQERIRPDAYLRTPTRSSTETAATTARFPLLFTGEF